MTKKQLISEAADIRPGDERGFFCYIGPSITGRLEHGAVLPAPREAALRAAAGAIERYPLVKTLIVSDRELADLRLRARTPGTALYNNCRRIAGGK